MANLITPILSTYRAYLNVNRLGRIVNVIFKNGLGAFFSHFASMVPSSLRRVQSEELSLSQRICRTLMELGPTYVKLGQMLSTRPDIIGEEAATEFSRLQNQVQPVEAKEMARVLQQELGAPVEEIFREFQWTPVGAASIAQGYRGVLQDGTIVFVKVQRPGIRREIMADLSVLKFLATYITDNVPECKYLMLPRMVEQFSDGILAELDFTIERTNQKHFARQFAGRDDVVVPKLREELCTRQMLVMEWVEGIKADNLERLRQEGYDLKLIAERGAQLALEQFYTHGFFHADPHPGNLFVLPDNRLCYIDFGLCGRLTAEERRIFCRLIAAVLRRDCRSAAMLLLRICAYDREPDLPELECAIAELADSVLVSELKHIDVPATAQRLFALCYRHKITLRPHVSMMVKAMAQSDNLGRLLDPQFDVEAHLRPYMERELLEHLNLLRSAASWMEWGADLKENLQRLPWSLRHLWRELLGGRLEFRHELSSKDEILSCFLRGVNRLTVGICALGTMVFSGMLFLGRVPPVIKGVSLSGSAAALTAAVLVLWLVVDIARYRK